HLEFIEQVAGRFLAAGGEALALQAHHTSCLAAGRNLKRDFAVDRWRGGLSAEGGLVVPYRKLTAYVTSADREDVVGRKVQSDEQIAVEIGPRAASALPLEP